MQVDLKALAGAFERLASVSGTSSREDAINELLRNLLAVVTPVASASVTLVVPAPMTLAATDDAARSIDEHQYRSGRGPCLEAGRKQQMVLFEPQRGDGRWPDLAELAASLDVGAFVSCPFSDAEKGALNAYYRKSASFDDEAIHLIRIFAVWTALTLAICELRDKHERDRRVAGELGQALKSRVVIEQAKGVLMAQRRIDASEAFRMLVAASQRENIKIHDVARRVVEGVTR